MIMIYLLMLWWMNINKFRSISLLLVRPYIIVKLYHAHMIIVGSGSQHRNSHRWILEIIFAQNYHIHHRDRFITTVIMMIEMIEMVIFIIDILIWKRYSNINMRPWANFESMNNSWKAHRVARRHCMFSLEIQFQFTHIRKSI